jgi:hypothetical protein
MAQKLEPTNKPGLYRRGDTYYARIYQSGTSKWISLKTTVKGVALAKLAKHTVERHAVRNAEDSISTRDRNHGRSVRVIPAESGDPDGH